MNPHNIAPRLQALKTRPAPQGENNKTQTQRDKKKLNTSSNPSYHPLRNCQNTPSPPQKKIAFPQWSLFFPPGRWTRMRAGQRPRTFELLSIFLFLGLTWGLGLGFSGFRVYCRVGGEGGGQACLLRFIVARVFGFSGVCVCFKVSAGLGLAPWVQSFGASSLGVGCLWS